MLRRASGGREGISSYEADPSLVFESKHFKVVPADQPHIARADGGHLVIIPKIPVEDRTKLSLKQAMELMKLTMVIGEAFKNALTRLGVDIGRINYQDNGNWSHRFHIHLYGRARDAIRQKYGEALIFPPTQADFEAQPALESLNSDDISAIRSEIEYLLSTKKYKGFRLN